MMRLDMVFPVYESVEAAIAAVARQHLTLAQIASGLLGRQAVDAAPLVAFKVGADLVQLEASVGGAVADARAQRRALPLGHRPEPRATFTFCASTFGVSMPLTSVAIGRLSV